jgi:Protein of unknown function (DUF2953)
MDTFLIPVFIIACIILFCECIVVLLYAVPLRFVLRLFHTEGQNEQSVLVSWGLIGCRIMNGDNQQKIEVCAGHHLILARPIESTQKRSDDEKIPQPADFRSGERYLTFFSGMIKPAGRFVSVLWQECRFENCTGSIRIGTKDPVATGVLYGGYWAARFGLMASRIFIEMKPDFYREIFEMDVAIRLRINHPLRIIIAGIQVMRNPAVRNAMSPEKSRSGGAVNV